MANRLTHKRRKCVKSPNIFRDKQEYSSLYTISSRSASSVQSIEMASQISKQNTNQVRIYKGQHQQGDSASTPVSGKLQNYGSKYPKLPSEVSEELQQKVYSNSHKTYYNDRSQFIKNKFDRLTLENNPHPMENKQLFPKAHYQSMRVNSPPNHHYTINRLEESYWAKWKPNKCDEMDTWRNYLDQAAYNRRSHCIATRMLPEECANMLAQTKRCHKNKCEEKLLKIIQKPAEIRESNSSDIGLNNKKTFDEKSVCSCCTCPQDESISDDEPVIIQGASLNNKEDAAKKRASLYKKEDAVKKYEMKQIEHIDEEKNLDTTQEEYENLYNEMCQEYETDLINKISEYEIQTEEEEMREVESQLGEQEEKRRNVQENSKKHRHGEIRFPTETNINQNQQMRENNSHFRQLAEHEEKKRNEQENSKKYRHGEIRFPTETNINQNQQMRENSSNLRQLAEQEEKKRNEQQNSKKYRHGEIRFPTETNINQNQQMRENSSNLIGREINNNFLGENVKDSSHRKQKKRIRISSQDQIKMISKEELLNNSYQEGLSFDANHENEMNTDEDVNEYKRFGNEINYDYDHYKKLSEMSHADSAQTSPRSETVTDPIEQARNYQVERKEELYNEKTSQHINPEEDRTSGSEKGRTYASEHIPYDESSPTSTTERARIEYISEEINSENRSQPNYSEEYRSSFEERRHYPSEKINYEERTPISTTERARTGYTSEETSPENKSQPNHSEEYRSSFAEQRRHPSEQINYEERTPTVATERAIRMRIEEQVNYEERTPTVDIERARRVRILEETYSEIKPQTINPEENRSSAQQQRYLSEQIHSGAMTPTVGTEHIRVNTPVEHAQRSTREEIQKSPAELRQRHQFERIYLEARPQKVFEERGRQDIEELYIKKVEERPRPNNEQQANTEEQRGTPINPEKPESILSEDRDRTNTDNQTRMSPTQSRDARNKLVESTRSSPRDKVRDVSEKQEQGQPTKDTPGLADEWEDYQKLERLLRKVPEKELTPHLSTSVEYSEPEISILKHTDSFIINSRRQKEDRPRKPQPKFIKLTKPAFTRTVKGHTYPLKPALKKEKPPPQPTIGFSRPLSPSPRTPSKQFLPSYLLRH